MTTGVVNWLFGLLFNLAIVGLIVGVLLIMGAITGGIETVWLSRTGLVLQILGITLFALEYFGVAQRGQSPLRWWLSRLAHNDEGAQMPALWPRQMILIVGAGALVIGLSLQLLSTWALSL